MTNTEPACTAAQGILPSATPVREAGVTNTEPACTAVRSILPSATSRNIALFSSCDSSLTSILFPVLQVEEYLNTCNCSGLILTRICFRVGSAAAHQEEESPLQGPTAGLGSHRWTITHPGRKQMSLPSSRIRSRVDAYNSTCQERRSKRQERRRKRFRGG